MKLKILLFSLALCVSYGTWAQTVTSFGGLIQPGTFSGTGGNDSSSYFGNEAGLINTGNWNTFIGAISGTSNTTGISNAFLGHNSGRDNTTGSYNTFIGRASGYSNETGSYNVFLGYRAGYYETTSNKLYIANSEIGLPLIWGDFANNELRFNGSVRITDIPQNNGLTRVLVAENDGDIRWRTAASLDTNTERTNEEIMDVVGAMVSGNTETRISVTYDDAANEFDFVVDDNLSNYTNDVGFITNPDDADADPTNEIQTLSYDANPHILSVSDGNSVNIAPFPSYPASAGDGGGATNSYFGHEAGINNTEISNTFIGYRSGRDNTTGSRNTFIGRESGFNNTIGSSNTFLGSTSGLSNDEGTHNTFIGTSSGYHNTTGIGNTFLGAASGQNTSTGTNNTFLGAYSGFDNDTGIFNTFIGHSSGQNNQSGNNNTLVGYESGSMNTEGENNTFVGYQSGLNNTANDNTFIGNQSGFNNEGTNNTFIGNRSGLNNTTGYENSSLGSRTLENNTTGHANTLVGFQSGLNNTTGYENSSLGSRTLENNTTGFRNTANGVFTLFGNTTGGENTAVGYAALGFNSTGNANTATGFRALVNNNGDNNTANGYQALENNNGDYNTAVGSQALDENDEGNGNVAIGESALSLNTDGNRNVAVGQGALANNETGSENIAVGYDSGPSNMSANLQNTIAIGPRALVGADNTIAIGEGAAATGNNSIAIGSGAMMTNNNEIQLGNLSHTDIRAAPVIMGFTPISDGRFKTNVEENITGLEFIKKLRPVSYELEYAQIHKFLTGKDAPNTLKNRMSMGFIAQEVEQIVAENDYIFTGIKKPENEKDHYGLRYVEFVVPLVKSVQELSALVESQQQTMEAQQQEIETLKNMVYGSGATNPSTSTDGLKEENTLFKGFSLAQNTPNPFNETTIISATVPETVREAKIAIYNLNGLELQNYDLNKRGTVSVEISSGVLPSGMYLYSLLADGRIIDTKKMILTR